MTIARRHQIRLEVTPYYHCITRCVRRAFLCGRDNYTGKSFEHRRKWIEDRLLYLNGVFCIKVVGYAVMSNHYHVIVRIDDSRAKELTQSEVIARWRKLYKGPPVVRKYLGDAVLSEEESNSLSQLVNVWREQLANISRFMGNLNEYIARRSNEEDACKGRFWESRFKLQAILDLPALLRTMCYVDLNPVRAKMAATPEQSEFTSVRRRLQKGDHNLAAFSEIISNEDRIRLDSVSIHATDPIPIKFEDYLELLDWTGRSQAKGKSGLVGEDQPPILDRLGFSRKQWLQFQEYRKKSWTQRAFGTVESVRAYCESIGQRWIWQLVT